MEVASFVMAILSLIASFGLAIWQTVTTIRLNKINLCSKVCEQIFDEYLIKKIPEARNKLIFDAKGYFDGAKQFQELILNMLKDAIYFRYNDKSFYEQLDKNVQDIENLLVENMEKKVDVVKQNDIINKIEIYIKNIYKVIENKKIKG